MVRYFYDGLGGDMHFGQAALIQGLVNLGQLDGEFLHCPGNRFIRPAWPQSDPQLGQADLVQPDILHRC